MQATAIAHPNIALIKYWGKRDNQSNLPAVGSLSVTLGGLRTCTTVTFDDARANDELIINGAEDLESTSRVSRCLDALRLMAGQHQKALVTTENDFPTGAGLASSASGYAALVTAAAAALGVDPSGEALMDIARMGSGSAPRSMLGGFVLLRNHGDTTRCEQVLAAGEWPLEVVIAITSAAVKPVSSRVGMERSRLTSPYYQAWIDSHAGDLDQALNCVQRRDFEGLGELTEQSCLKMHAVMMTTRPPLLYWSPTTLACLHAVMELRRRGTPAFFTVDAGPQVKVICQRASADDVSAAMEQIPGVLKVLVSRLGEGARQVSTDG